MKVYVGVRRNAGRQVLVAMAGEEGERDYHLCRVGEADDLTRVAAAILSDHLGSVENAQTMRGGIERALRARLEAAFWTITAAELDEALSAR